LVAHHVTEQGLHCLDMAQRKITDYEEVAGRQAIREWVCG
jgi:hypothetical protein